MDKDEFQAKIDDILTNLYENANTRQQIKYMLGKFYRVTGSTNAIECVLSEEAIDKYLDNCGKSIASKATLLGKIIGFVKRIKDKYREFYDSVFPENYIETLTAKSTPFIESREAEKKNGLGRANARTERLTLDDFYEIYDKVNKSDQNIEEKTVFLLVALVVLLPPRRLDWGLAVFVDEYPENAEGRNLNYVLVKDDVVTLRFYNFKTAKYLTKERYWERKLINDSFEYLHLVQKFTRVNPEALAAILKTMFVANKPLFPSKDGNVMDPRSFSKWSTRLLQKYSNKKLTYTNARGLFITRINKTNELNYYMREQIGRDMGHTIDSAIKYEHITQPESKDNESDSDSDSDDELWSSFIQPDTVNDERQNINDNKATQNVNDSPIKQINNVHSNNNILQKLIDRGLLEKFIRHNPDYVCSLL